MRYLWFAHRGLQAFVASAAFVFSISPAASAFRTIADYPEVPDDARVRWPNGEFQFWTYDHGIDSVSSERLTEMSRRAFLAWQSSSCARISTNHLGISPLPAEPGDGMNTIEIVDEDWEGLGFPSDAAGANDMLFEEQDDGSWAIVEADIYINAANFTWTTSTSPEGDDRSLLGVLTHEGGHALGLLHPCEPDGVDGAPACGPDDAPGDLMSPFYQADQLYPEEEDYAGLCYLYSRCETEGCEAGFRCEEGECVPLDGDGDGRCDDGTGGYGGEDAEACTPKIPLGSECTESDECEDGQCLAGVKKFPICTRLCGGGEPACPHSWTCTKVEDRQVCMPPAEDPGCQCALGTEPASARPSAASRLLVLASFGIASLVRRRRRRAGRAEGRIGEVSSETKS